MSREIPSNEVRTMECVVARNELLGFLGTVNKHAHIVRVAYEEYDGRYKVLIEYAIMDLAIQLSAVAYELERMAEEVNKKARASS